MFAARYYAPFYFAAYYYPEGGAMTLPDAPVVPDTPLPAFIHNTSNLMERSRDLLLLIREALQR